MSQTPDAEAEFFFQQGLHHAEVEKYEAAIASYNQAVAIKLEYQEAWYNRGIALWELVRYEEAVTSYDKALEIEPDSDSAWLNRGAALLRLGQVSGAIASLNELNTDFAITFLKARFNQAITSVLKKLGWQKRLC